MTPSSHQLYASSSLTIFLSFFNNFYRLHFFLAVAVEMAWHDNSSEASLDCTTDDDNALAVYHIKSPLTTTAKTIAASDDSEVKIFYFRMIKFSTTSSLRDTLRCADMVTAPRAADISPPPREPRTVNVFLCLVYLVFCV